MKVVVALAPIVIGCVVTLLVNPRLPFDRTPVQLIGRVATLVVIATTVVYGVERLARRLLPLSTLLSLSLVFPDHAPSRFKLAIRSGSTRQLEQRLAADGASMNELAVDALGLVAALNAHDRRTRGHSERVRAYATLIGEELHLDQDELDKLQWAALLHDIGKLSVPASILNKDGRPSDEEWAILAGHPAAGVEPMAALEPWLGEWVGSAGEHHERWDGRGYPAGLAGTGISRAGRIVAVADAFEVMTAVRSYKKPMSVAAARTEVTDCAGGQFDPAVVRALLNVSLGDLRSVAGPIAGLLQLPLAGNLLSGMSGIVTTGAVASAAVATGIVGSALLLPSPDPSAAAAPNPVTELVAPDAGSSTAARGGPSRGEDAPATGDDGATATAPGSDPSLAIGPDGSTSTTTPGGDPGTGPGGSPGDGGGGASTTTAPRAPGDGPTPGASSTTTPTTTPPTSPPATEPPTTVPDVGPTPPTSVPTPQNGSYFLGTSGSGDTGSSTRLPLWTSAPTATALANYDTDRDSSPGLSLDSSGPGSNGTGQLWSIAPTVDITLLARGSVTVWAAPRNGSGNRTLIAGLYDCNAAGGGCRRIAHGSVGVPSTGGFVPVTVDLGPVTRVVGVGRQLVLQLQAGNGPVTIAYGTSAHPSAISFS